MHVLLKKPINIKQLMYETAVMISLACCPAPPSFYQVALPPDDTCGFAHEVSLCVCVSECASVCLGVSAHAAAAKPPLGLSPARVKSFDLDVAAFL